MLIISHVKHTFWLFSEDSRKQPRVKILKKISRVVIQHDVIDVRYQGVGITINPKRKHSVFKGNRDFFVIENIKKLPL